MTPSASTTSCRRRTLPPLAKRGPLASDAALTEEIIRQADATNEPFFFFAVSLQSHGPYEPNRYPDTTHKVETRGELVVARVDRHLCGRRLGRRHAA